MKKVNFLLAMALVAMVLLQTANAQVTVTGSTGANATYTTLGAAFTAINTNTNQSGNNIVITITASTNESTTTASLTGQATNTWATLKIYPTVTGLSISGSPAAPLIKLNGAKNVTIDGRVNATGETKDLIITNTSTSNTAGTSTIQFINDASTNTVQYCTLKGSTTDAAAGVLFFSTTTGANGNDGNTIDNNNITNSTDLNRPLNAVYSAGTSAAKSNSGNTISNNNIYNFLSRGTASNGIQLAAYNTGWTISANSFYETASFGPTAAVDYTVINVSAITSTDIAISGNFIGGSAANCGTTGSVTSWTKTNMYTNIFYAINLNVGPKVSEETSVQGNTIKNFVWGDAGVASSGWSAIAIPTTATGAVNIGTVTGNTIGATTGIGSIAVTSMAAGNRVNGIDIRGTGTVDCQNNTIGAITAANLEFQYSTNFQGIYKNNSGTTTISNNTIGSTTTANSINASSRSTTVAQQVYGIYSQGSGTVIISGNTISKLTNGTDCSSATTTGCVFGIYASGETMTITTNTIRDLTIANANSESFPNSVTGIFQASSTGAQTISGNTIYNLSNTYGAFAGYVNGIFYYSGPGASTVSGNFIHSLTVSSNSGAKLSGIYIREGIATYSNNIISLGNSTNSELSGIYESAGTNNIYFNTVYISGTGGSYGSYGLRNLNGVGTTRNYRNNLFVNVRTGGPNYCVALGNTTGLTMDYNDYICPSGTAVWFIGIGCNTLAQIQAGLAGQNLHSLTTDPAFASAGGTVAANYIPASLALVGVTGTGITTDYAGTTRSVTAPAMGAYDYPVSGWVVVTATLGTATGTYTSLKAAFDAINAGTHKGVIAIKINASTTESATAALNASAATSAGNPFYTSVNVYPTLTGLSITGSLAAPLIDLNGADNVTFDGRVNATGTTKDLIISNTSTATTAGTSDIRFINDATSNTVKYCTLKGSTMDASGGILFFSTTTGTTGNDGNTIDNNNFTNVSDANRPLSAIYSNGTIAKTNSGNTISNNNFYNFFCKTGLSIGVYLNTYNTGWTISANSFYETTSFAQAGQSGMIVIGVRDVTSSDITISGNYIGGSAPNCGGKAWTKTSASRNVFYGIQLYVGPTVNTPTSVQGNTIKNFNWGDDATGTNTWTAISAGGTGAVNIGTVTGNTIGATTGTNSIYLYSYNTYGEFTGIQIGTTGTVDCRNNTVGAIYGSGSNANYAYSIYGIRKTASAGTATISNNTIGSTSTANSINSGSAAWSNTQIVAGIYSDGTGTVGISGNTIANLNNTSNAGTTIPNQAIGIQTTNGTNTIANNTIRNLSCANANNSATTPSVVGIAQTSTVAAAQSVTGNTIYNLSSTYASFTGAITGIYYAGPATASAVSGNFIHTLSVSSTAAASYGLNGMYINGGTTTYSNNIINVGNNTAITVNGIRDVSGVNYFYFNTVYIGGAPTTGGFASYAVCSSSSTTRYYKNNLLINARTNNGSTGNHYAAFFSSTTFLTIDYNDYQTKATYVDVNSGGPLCFLNGTYCYTLAQVKAAYLNWNSLNTNPAFANAGGTVAANYIPASLALLGVTGTGITTDYAGTTRTYNSMGAYDYSVTGLVGVTATLGTATGTYTSLKAAFDAINAGTHKGVIAIKINGNTSESVSAVLNASGTGSSSYTSVNVYPTVSGLSISGNLAFPLIDLNGADNVTIDGRVNATGATKSLEITNTSTSTDAGTSTIRFYNDASTNTVKYCTIKGSSMAGTCGMLFFGAGATLGNNNNTIDNNNITSAADASRPFCAVYSSGLHSNNSITNNNIYNFFNRSYTSFGIWMSVHTSAPIVSGNSFYETASFVPASTASYFVIYYDRVTGGTISNNYIGGNAANCVGSWVKTSASTYTFYAIYLSGSVTAASVQGNTIANLSITTSAATSLYGIYVESGDANIGTVTGNTIGATTGTGSIAVSTNTTEGKAYGIYIGGTGTVNCQNNKIGAITTDNPNSANATSFYGIYKTSSAGTTTISNNTIGSTQTSYSIRAHSVSITYPQYAIGIKTEGTGVQTISGNTISELLNESTGPIGNVVGIITTSGTNTIQNNTVRNLMNTNRQVALYENSSVVGIAQISTTAAAQTVSGNTIYNLSNQYGGGFAGSVIGLYYNGPATASKVSGNFIHSLTVGLSSGANISGMYISGGTTTYSNNIIKLGGSIVNWLQGIYDWGGTNSYYFNTVYLNPTFSSGTIYSYCIRTPNSNTRNIRNNLFVNMGSNSTGYCFAVEITSHTNLTIDYNDYMVYTGAGRYLGYITGSYASTLAELKNLTHQDALSLNNDPAFASAGGTLAINYQVPVASTLPGITIAGQTADYAGTTRAATPTMGAYEKGLFSQVVTFTAMTAKTYGAADFTPTVTASSGLTSFTYTSSNTAVATVNSSTGLIHIVGAGIANITATQAGNATWASASATSSLTVNPKALTLATAAAQNKSYDGTNAAVLTGTLTGVINSDDVTVAKTGTFASINVGTGIAVTSTSTLGGTKAGNYSLTQPTGLTANITTGVQTITFGALASKTYGDAPFVVSATGGASGNPVTFTSSDPTVASCSGTNGATVTIYKAGSCSIYADQAGNSLYAAATQVAQTLTISKANQVITLSPLPVGSLPLNTFTTIQVTATSNSGLTVAISLGAGSAATLNGSNQLENIGLTGTVVINLSAEGNDNYNAATSSYTFDVVKSNQTITFGALSGVTYTSGLTVEMSGKASASSTLAVSYSVVSGPATITGTALNISGAGEVVVAASQAGDAAWNPAADVTQTLAVSQATQTITFDALAAKNYGDADFTLSATGGGSGNAVTFSSSDPTIASCDGTNGATVSILKAGSCVIYADQAGNSTFTAATQVSQALTINKGDQLLTMGSLPVGNLPLNQFTDPIQVTASSTSGLMVTITLGSGSAATLNGSNQLVSIGQTGTVVINLSQDGNDNYNSATGSYSFDVTKSNQNISFDALADKVMGDPDYSPGATASSALTVSYSSSNTDVATIVSGQIHIAGAGNTTITASQDGDATWN
ncbi:MAG: beta strand repeat-containing protein, partial [Bacteroidales bacterium]